MSDQPTPQPTQVDPQAVVNDLAQQVAQQAVGLAMLRTQLAAVTAERDQLLGERELLIAAQEQAQGCGEG